MEEKKKKKKKEEKNEEEVKGVNEEAEGYSWMNIGEKSIRTASVQLRKCFKVIGFASCQTFQHLSG